MKMKAILMSIQPKWCEKIFNGEKTVEVRNTAPKIETPFKVYVYCTKSRLTKHLCINSYLHRVEPRKEREFGKIEKWGSIGDVIVNSGTPFQFTSFQMHGKVIGEFICYEVEDICCLSPCDFVMTFSPEYKSPVGSCITAEELMEYGKGKLLYGWHISDLKIYDKPRKLGEFSRYGYKAIEHSGSGCVFCGNTQCKHSNPEEVIAGYYIPPICKIDGCTLTRPPQSWQYVEEL